MVQLDPGPNRGRPRLECPGDAATVARSARASTRGVASTGTSPLPIAAAVSASVTVCRKAARRPGSSVMAQPYAAPPPLGRPPAPAINEASSAIRRPMPY
jgi:hypothetical protein